MKPIKNYYPMQADKRTPRYYTVVRRSQFRGLLSVLKADRVPYRIRKSEDGHLFYFKDNSRLLKAIRVIEIMNWHEQMMTN